MKMLLFNTLCTSQAICGGNTKTDLLVSCMLLIITSFKIYVTSSNSVVQPLCVLPDMCQVSIRKYVFNVIVRIDRSNIIIIRNIVSYGTPFMSNIW